MTLVFILFFFNLRLIILQYCGGFSIRSHESAMGVHVFPIPTLPPWSLSCIESFQRSGPGVNLFSIIVPGLCGSYEQRHMPFFILEDYLSLFFYNFLPFVLTFSY